MLVSLVRSFSRQGIRVPVSRFSTYNALRSNSDYKSDAPNYEHILTESHDKVGLITLNRPKTFNALSSDLFHEINDALKKFENDSSIGAIVITGNERAFSAGADIKEMLNQTFANSYKTNFLFHWGEINNIKKPVIAAVNGFALGGGCELAMSCDVIYAGETAKFGQPEIKLGLIPGAGGTQRLTRVIGKSKAMELVLSGRTFTAQEAEQWGLVSKVFPVGEVLEKAIELGQEFAGFSQPVIQAAKESVNSAYELSLREGCHFERRIFQALFSLNDAKEGKDAFANKREAKWTHD
ncbi:ClpP/crotonase-like domain-containing protein [Gigaspora rosea]|uniref:Probable enoyl-CoA hydratase, mitochondrial n=1 Tax=Gigaspora rosea TaxID=44941 RepID=A0A397UNJ8_9GLOM|nr:ClpP/crotonase-like domain-containing protein [Gigaspora rosea]